MTLLEATKFNTINKLVISIKNSQHTNINNFINYLNSLNFIKVFTIGKQKFITIYPKRKEYIITYANPTIGTIPYILSDIEFE